MKKKVLINGSILTNKKIGVEIYTIEVLNKLIPMLISKEYEIDLYLYEKNSLWKNFKINQIEIRTIKILDIILKNFKSFHRILWGLLWLPKLAKKYEIIYSTSTHGGLSINNQVVTLHDLISLKFPLNNKFQYLYFKFIVPQILKSSKVISISNYTKSDACLNYNLNPKSIHTVYNGCNHLKFNFISADITETKNVDKYFLSVGLSLPHKNVENLLNAIHALNRRDYKFIIIARNTKYIFKMKQKAKLLNLDNVIFLSNVSNDKLSQLYSNCIANIYLSLYEGFGFPPIEAAIFNKVSIVSNNSSLGELYDNYSITADPNDYIDIKNKIENLIDGKYQIKINEIDFDSLVNKYTWENCASNILNILTTK